MNYPEEIKSARIKVKLLKDRFVIFKTKLSKLKIGDIVYTKKDSNSYEQHIIKKININKGIIIVKDDKRRLKLTNFFIKNDKDKMEFIF